MNKFVFLSKEFYARHKEQQHTEIEQKQDRPYIQVCVEIDGVQYAITMRSHIKHKFVLWTDKNNGCGLDFSKVVVIESLKDIGCQYMLFLGLYPTDKTASTDI